MHRSGTQPRPAYQCRRSRPCKLRKCIEHTRLVEANMSTIFNPAADLRGLAVRDAVWIGDLVRRCWREFLRWQDEQAAIAQLSAMSDRELRDIGLNRSEIGFVRKGAEAHT